MTNQSASWPDLKPRLNEQSRMWEVRDAGVIEAFETVDEAEAFVIERVAAADPAAAQARSKGYSVVPALHCFRHEKRLVGRFAVRTPSGGVVATTFDTEAEAWEFADLWS